ncbi:hypothetical protein [Vibrio parahaemolyticus]|uniref:hypothetical protein n=1 Tax=Vibrio parahaemolyticus TaxID=670 RepID=UPI003D81741D
MAVIVGVPSDDGISNYNKCYITGHVGEVEVTVIGYMTDECQLSFRALWESPFEGDTVGNAGVLDKTASITQTIGERTSKTLFNSEQVWQGNEPPEVTITLRFVAYTNAKSEVDDPIKYLCQFASPELQNEVPISANNGGIQLGGRIPAEATFNIGRKVVMPMRISEVNYDVNAPKTKHGNFAYNTVSITASPKQMVNQSVIPNHLQ